MTGVQTCALPICFPVTIGSLVKVDSPDPVVKGTVLRYTINVTNSGDDDAFNVSVVDNYPVGVVFNGSYPSPSSGNGTFSLGSLSAGREFLINITVNVSSSLSNGSVIVNNVNLTFVNGSGQSSRVSASASTTVLGYPSVLTSKVSVPSVAGRGSTVLTDVS